MRRLVSLCSLRFVIVMLKVTFSPTRASFGPLWTSRTCGAVVVVLEGGAGAGVIGGDGAVGGEGAIGVAGEGRAGGGVASGSRGLT